MIVEINYFRIVAYITIQLIEFITQPYFLIIVTLSELLSHHTFPLVCHLNYDVVIYSMLAIARYQCD